MKALTLKSRRRPENREQFAVETDLEETPDTAMAWTGPAAWITKTMSYALIACLITGPIALVLAYLTLSRPTAAPTASSTADVSAGATERAAVSGFAEDFVVTWLTSPRGQEKQLDRFVVDASRVTLAEKPWSVAAPATASIEPTDQPGVWSVTVAITVDEGKDLPPVRRYFQVPVLHSDTSALRAQTLPAPVAAPTVADPGRLAYRYRATPTDPVAAAANDFLSALLAGSSDVARYISPGSEISAIDPAPYTTVVIEDVMVDEDPAEDDTAPANGEERQLLVTATVTADAKQNVTVQYSLTLEARDGRWEVKSIDLAPVVTDPSSAATDGFESPALEEPVEPTTSTTN